MPNELCITQWVIGHLENLIFQNCSLNKSTVYKGDFDKIAGFSRSPIELLILSGLIALLIQFSQENGDGKDVLGMSRNVSGLYQ